MSYSASLGTTGMLDPGTAGGAGSAGLSLGTGTGQQGTQTINTGNSNPFVATYSWLQTPFTTPLSPWSVFLLVGVVIIAVIAWNMILYHVRIAAEAI